MFCSHINDKNAKPKEFVSKARFMLQHMPKKHLKTFETLETDPENEKNR